ncbi:MAG: rod shape-determining protein [Candidatus Nealsonbacteria bacterium CG23_combo_of_CG06-09_8_20_14_all_37_18]|uniref:Cell shape-determining protein MreB n=1 Tax=Candidatus Nealsonbacteria bacterium CG23_combo_of_CG06-09_8_20_14_all_37_18 TaxID=1974720 RepID=A0A2G9YYW5_9BACT|nr:MAG: rod shape-determining protein [Candidatus Nealsonbacteria bacterium CG23_combo_of_CG06-09_8_20_14_all_37_18]
MKKIGIDLGTCNSLVFLPGKGVVLQEPSVVAVSLEENRILAIGEEAKAMIGRTPDTIRVYRPLKDGVIADFRVTQAMLKYFIDKVGGFWRFLKPELMIGVPAGITSTERRAVVEAALNAGAKQAYLAKEPILAAIGAGIPINSCSGNMIVDIGGGTSEIAVISLGGIVTCNSTRVGGDKMDLAISDYIKKKYNLAVGEQTAEEIKIKIGTALPEKEAKFLEIRGRDLIYGLPRTIRISSNEISEAISDILGEIIHVIKAVLRDTPPELSADIIDKGMILSGGGVLLRNITERISQETGVPCFLAEDPLLCVAKGTGVVLENLDMYKKSIMSKR